MRALGNPAISSFQKEKKCPTKSLFPCSIAVVDQAVSQREPQIAQSYYYYLTVVLAAACKIDAALTISAPWLHLIPIPPLLRDCVVY